MDERPLTRADLVELLSALSNDLKANLAELHGEFRTDLADLRGEFKADLAGLRDEFKADLAELRTEFKAGLAELRTEFKADLAEQRREILETTQEQVRDAQTEILKAFLPFREEHDIKFRAFEVRLPNTEAELRARMDVLSRRLGEIEERLRMNPPAA